MAEALLQAGNSQLNVSSAGIGALVGHPADPIAIELMSEQGIDISAHRGRQLTPEVGAGSDLILAMDRGHLDWINRNFPQFRGRVHLLLSWPEQGDVPDPYRAPRAAFEKSLALIQVGVDAWLEKLRGMR